MSLVSLFVTCRALTAPLDNPNNVALRMGRDRAGSVRVGRCCPGGEAGRHPRRAQGDRTVPHGGISGRIHRRWRVALCLGGGDFYVGSGTACLAAAGCPCPRPACLECRGERPVDLSRPYYTWGLRGMLAGRVGGGVLDSGRILLPILNFSS